MLNKLHFLSFSSGSLWVVPTVPDLLRNFPASCRGERGGGSSGRETGSSRAFLGPESWDQLHHSQKWYFFLRISQPKPGTVSGDEIQFGHRSLNANVFNYNAPKKNTQNILFIFQMSIGTVILKRNMWMKSVKLWIYFVEYDKIRKINTHFFAISNKINHRCGWRGCGLNVSPVCSAVHLKPPDWFDQFTADLSWENDYFPKTYDFVKGLDN